MVGKHFPSRSKFKYGKKNSVGSMEGLCLDKSLKEILEKLDPDTAKTMRRNLDELTSSGSPSLDEKVLKHFKRLCRKSDDYVKYAFFIIIQRLQKKHSEIRLSAFQVANELFYRSHAFREILIIHLQEFLTLTTGLETGHELPPPKSAAIRLKTDSLKAMQEWHEKFSKAYRKLAVGYDYLKNCKHIDFNNIQAQNLAERQRIEIEEEKKQKLMSDRLAKVLADIAENKTEIEDCLKEAENCLKLIFPTPMDFSVPDLANWVDEKASSLTDSNMCNKSKSDLLNNSHNGETHKIKDEIKADIINTSNSSPPFPEQNRKFEELAGKTKENTSDCVLNNAKTKSESCESTNLEGNCDRSKNAENQVGLYCTDSKDIKLGSDGSKEFHSKDHLIDSETTLSDATENIGRKRNDLEEEEEVNSSDEDIEEEDECDLQVHGFRQPGFSLTIEVPAKNITVKETDDNTALMQTMKDASKLVIGSYLPKVTKWLEILSKNGAKEKDIKSMIDLKVELESVNQKCQDLKLLVSDEKVEVNEDSDDEDLEDVPEKEGYEPRIPDHLREEYGLSSTSGSTSSSSINTKSSSSSVKRKSSTDISAPDTDHSSLIKKMSTSLFWSLRERELSESVNDPTSRAAALARINQEICLLPSTSQSSQDDSSSSPSSSKVPFVEFGKDLAYWENPDEMEAPSIIKYDSLHRFWTPSEKESEKPSEHDKAAMQYRTFSFTGKFEPVKWKCRAPMPNGKLCVRMDRIKCPFHGKIIARDEDGKPSNSNIKQEPKEVNQLGSLDGEPSNIKEEPTTDENPSGSSEIQKGLQPWKDPELQREIEAATGHDLGSARSQKLLDKACNKGKGKGKRKGKKASGLTDINAATKTTRKRLEKRIFNKTSMKKVCSRLDAADYKRVRDKFGNQFSYSLQ